ncbi:MAG: hypothetical protein Q7R41_17220 [Phycisphaerales bacterium]|nr:hypothetical protein [Phycisphaerales bacterium]
MTKNTTVKWFLAVLAVTVVGCPQPAAIPPSGGDSLFRDDFDGTLQAGWSIDASSDADVDLSSRTGFARLLPPESPDPSVQTTRTLLLRDMDGDFVLVTRMEFQTITDLQLSGLVIQGDESRTVVLGLFSATGASGSLRGLFLRADRGAGVDPGRAITPSDLDNVYLRLERSGNSYTGSYSSDGVTFTVVGTVTDDLSDRVGTGIGTAADTRCTANCDQRTPADFDFFEILAPDASSGS